MPSNNEGTVLLLPSVGLHEINEKIFGWGVGDTVGKKHN